MGTTDSRAMILGGTGFVGRHVCAELASRGREVTVVGRRPPEREFPFRFVPLDLGATPEEELSALLAAESPDTVVNCVGSIWTRDDKAMWAVAAEPVLRLVEALRRLPGPPRLVHLGSVLEYGPVPAGTTVGASVRPAPNGAYGKAKLAATEAVLAGAAAGDFDAVVLRVANVAGPGSPEVSLLGRVARQLLAAAGTTGPAMIELAPLRAHRDYVDVRDVAEAVAAAAEAEVTAEVVDIGRGEAVWVRSLVDLLVQASGIPARVVERGEPGGPAQDWLQVDTRPAARLLGWSPRRSLADAVSALWNEVAPTTNASNGMGG
ncbi:NAD-dependent epimerase/dehydratase family protein [Streptomyces bacillaris]|uniref:NAD-dependent epimerase/dehydratase family protein n=1 Tax=Streptomyces bacillaris TaxID=68179 RepID=UPI003460354C